MVPPAQPVPLEQTVPRDLQENKARQVFPVRRGKRVRQEVPEMSAIAVQPERSARRALQGLLAQLAQPETMGPPGLQV